jgi:enoyl-CoA hydratase/carnithine racemase
MPKCSRVLGVLLTLPAHSSHSGFWPGKDVNWFRTFVAEVNCSYRAIEMPKIPTVALVRGVAFGGGFELALTCDFLVAAESATFHCVEVTTAMLPIAGALQRLAERAGRARASRFAMLGERISGTEAGALVIATHVVPEDQLAAAAAALTHQLAIGTTRSYAATRTLLKAWSSGGVAAADIVMLDVAMELFNGADAQRGFANTADAFNKDIEPATLVFEGK